MYMMLTTHIHGFEHVYSNIHTHTQEGHSRRVVTVLYIAHTDLLPSFVQPPVSFALSETPSSLRFLLDFYPTFFHSDTWHQNSF